MEYSRAQIVEEVVVFFFSSRRRHTRFDCDWSSDVCSSDLQQGYLRVWIDNELVRVDDDPKKIKRLGARVQVIQDRIAITIENRARFIEEIGRASCRERV